MLEISDNMGIDFYVWDYVKGKYIFEQCVGAGHERTCHLKKINWKTAKAAFSLLERSPPIDTYHSTNDNTKLYKSLVLLLSDLFGARSVINTIKYNLTKHPIRNRNLLRKNHGGDAPFHGVLPKRSDGVTPCIGDAQLQ